MTSEQPETQNETDAAGMTEVMEAAGATAALNPLNESFDEFLQTGRTGRRNAMPHIMNPQQAQVGTGDLPCEMGKLTCTDSPTETVGTSSEGSEGSSTSANGEAETPQD